MQAFSFAAQAVATGLGLVSLGMLLGRKERGAVATAYLPFLCALTLQSAAAVAGHYASAAAGFVDGWRWRLFAGTIVSSLLAWASPRFFLAFANVPFRGALRRAAIAAAAAGIAVSPAAFLGSGHPALPFVPSMLSTGAFLCFMLYSQYRLVRAYPRIRDRLGRIGVPAIILYNAAMTALGILESMEAGAQAAAGGWPPGLGILPLVTIAWHVLGLWWLGGLGGAGSVGPEDEVDAAAAARYGLTPRETELCRRLARGESNKEIAAAVGLSANTVRNHVHNAFEKVGARNRVELCARLRNPRAPSSRQRPS